MPPADDGNPLAPFHHRFQFTFDTTQRVSRLACRNRCVIEGFEQIGQHNCPGICLLDRGNCGVIDLIVGEVNNQLADLHSCCSNHFFIIRSTPMTFPMILKVAASFLSISMGSNLGFSAFNEIPRSVR